MYRLSLFIGLALALILSAASASAQSLSGKIIDAQERPLPGVNVIVPALQLVVASDAQGKYSFKKIPPGTYTVEFYVLGYEREVRNVKVSGEPIALNMTLHESPLEMPAITVTAKPQPSDILNSAQPIGTVEDRQLDRQRGQSITKSMENMAGVSMTSGGPLNTKPVIRGLTSQRVVVVENGMRHESQQWDDVQSPEIDALDVERIEVVRGPNSVLYGSDALGGVVNIITDDMESLASDLPTLGGEVLINGFSNSGQVAGGLTLEGRRENVTYKTQFSTRQAGDMTTPGGRLYNSSGRELNGKAIVGTRESWGNLSLGYSHFNQKLQVHPDPADVPVEDPFQNITHDKVNLSYSLPFSTFRLETHGTLQRNEEREFDNGGQTWQESPVPIENLILKTLSVDSKLHHRLVGDVFGTFGVSVSDQRNETHGLEALVPAFRQVNFASFVYEELRLSDLSFSTGFRFDTRRLDVEENSQLNLSAQTRTYNAITGTAGVVWHLTSPFSIAMNLGRGWRAPIAEELFVSGYEPGSIRFKVGNSSLEPEASLNLDVVGRYSSARLRAEASFFHDRINRYIYLSKTNEIDSTSGLTIYRHLQTNATLIGSELDVEAVATDHLVLHAGADFVFGRNYETDTWLPLLTPNRFKLGFRLSDPMFLMFHNSYFALNSRIVLDQNRVDQYETPTPGYALFDLGFGGELGAGAHRLEIDCSVDNLFNRAYRDHLSRYKEYALNPGFDMTLKLAVPFSLVE